MSWEFRVGQKVVCVDAVWNKARKDAGLTRPVSGGLYTIRGFDHLTVNVCVWLEEIVNPPRNYLEGFSELSFKASRFRPLVTDTQKWLREVLETPPSTTKRHEVERL